MYLAGIYFSAFIHKSYSVSGRYNNYGWYEADYHKRVSDIMKVCKHVGLAINQENTKYVFITSDILYDEDESYLEVDAILFQ